MAGRTKFTIQWNWPWPRNHIGTPFGHYHQNKNTTALHTPPPSIPHWPPAPPHSMDPHTAQNPGHPPPSSSPPTWLPPSLPLELGAGRTARRPLWWISSFASASSAGTRDADRGTVARMGPLEVATVVRLREATARRIRSAISKPAPVSSPGSRIAKSRRRKSGPGTS